jgi:hypothetical protein
MEKESESRLIVVCAWHEPVKVWWNGSQDTEFGKEGD